MSRYNIGSVICVGLVASIVGLLPAYGAPTSSATTDKPVSSAGTDNLENLPIGDPARREFQAPLVLDGVTNTSTRKVIGPSEMASQLKDVGILFLGENHTNEEFHDVQLQTIQALHEAGRDVLIGLEMLPYTEQKVLDNWTAGQYTETEFLKAADWYQNWGHHFNYYREIFRYARDNKLPMYGVNTPRDVVKRIRADGFDALRPGERAHFPPKFAAESDEHRRMYRANFSADDTLHMNAAALDGLYRAQTTWDATMGWNALEALRARGNDKKSIMVVLLGSGHVIYGLGAERQIDPWYDGKIASLVPVPVIDETGKAVPSVRASYASYIWGLPQQREPHYPVLGVSLMGKMGKEPRQIIEVSKDSVAERAGIQVGDVLERFGDTPIKTETEFRRLVAGLRWGDVVPVTVRRKDASLTLSVPVRRVRPAACSAADPGATNPG
ncbi:MAG: ChaN family lipoprotein [Gammaproteobacteria bacterium]